MAPAGIVSGVSDATRLWIDSTDVASGMLMPHDVASGNRSLSEDVEAGYSGSYEKAVSARATPLI